jgi:hypothetical protein
MGIGKKYRIDYVVTKQFNFAAPHPMPLTGPLTPELVKSLEKEYIITIAVCATVFFIAPFLVCFVIKKKRNHNKNK